MRKLLNLIKNSIYDYKTQFVDELKGIDIKKSDDVFLIYMHLDSVSVSKEDAASKKEIGAGFILGYAGVSGSIASGGRAPNLHKNLLNKEYESAANEFLDITN